MDDPTNNIGGFKDGSITEICLSNFMTHGNTVIQPGPRMNVVVGANGTGKSSILSAICLGLGGTPKLLGRADDLRAFVKNGENVASITVTLAPGNHKFCRTIDARKGSDRGRGKGASTFFINDRKSSIEEVREIVRGTYFIQIENLCTFLPQEKVGSFSGLTDPQRLLEAEKTLPKNLHEKHMEIIELQNSLSTHESDLAALEATLAKRKQELDRLEIDKGREEDRLQAASQVELYRSKRLWLEFEDFRKQTVDLKETKKKCKTKLAEAERALQPLREKHAELATAIKKVDVSVKKMEDKSNLALKSMEAQYKKYDSHDDSVERCFGDLNEVDSEREQNIINHKKAVERLESMTKSIANAEPIAEVEAKIEHLNNSFRVTTKEFSEAKREYSQMERELDRLKEEAKAAETKLNKLNDTDARRRENAFRQDPQLKTIYNFVKENSSIFRKPVLGPISIEVKPCSQLAAAQVEMHVPNNIWRSFVCQTTSDRQLLYREIREKQGIPINVICVENLGAEARRIYSDAVFSTMQSEYGISGYLDELYEAPTPVRVALEKFARPSKVLVGNERTLDAIDKKGFLDHLARVSNGGSCVMAAKYRFSQTKSEYSGNMSTREDQVGPSRLLTTGIDEGVKEKVQVEFEAKKGEVDQFFARFSGMQKKLNDLEVQAQELKLHVDNTKAQSADLKKMEVRIRRQRIKVDEASAAVAVDSTTEKKRQHVESILNHFSGMLKAMNVHGKQQDALMHSTTESAAIRVQQTAISHRERGAREDLSEGESSTQHLKAKSQQVEKDFKSKMSQLKEKKLQAESEAPLNDDDGNPLPLKEQLESLDVVTVEECDAAVEEAQGCLEKYSANPEVLRQYERLKDDVALMEEKVTNSSENRAGQNKSIEKKLESYVSPLENCISKVNAKFSTYMAEMGCTGEVRLAKKGEDERNFKDWGLEILVSFREGTKAQVLSASRHSGGERSVSTIMFLMALQDMMVSPFRSVDEINQGLDDRNERLVFHRIVENSTRPPERGDEQDHSGQYFLITPKLLPNLTDMENEAVTILFVFNGQFNFADPLDWNKHMAAANGDGVDGGENANKRISKKRKS